MITSNAKSRIRREQDILERLENVKRLIQMETTIVTTIGARNFGGYVMVDREGKKHPGQNNLLHELRDEIQLQLLSIVALHYGDNPDIGEPAPMLEWRDNGGTEDDFREMWEKYLTWNI